MERNANFDRGSGRRRRVVGSQINQAKRDEKSRWLREGDKPKQGQDPDQGFPITVYPENKRSEERRVGKECRYRWSP